MRRSSEGVGIPPMGPTPFRFVRFSDAQIRLASDKMAASRHSLHCSECVKNLTLANAAANEGPSGYGCERWRGSRFATGCKKSGIRQQTPVTELRRSHNTRYSCDLVNLGDVGCASWIWRFCWPRLYRSRRQPFPKRLMDTTAPLTVPDIRLDMIGRKGTILLIRTIAPEIPRALLRVANPTPKKTAVVMMIPNN